MNDMKKENHQKLIVDQFSKQAIPFANLPGHLDSIEMLIKICDVNSEDTVLDVACGPGLVVFEFAKIAKKVTGIDITPDMITKAKEAQCKTDLKNIIWDIGDVQPLPYNNNSFDLVLTRYSFHHFIKPEKVLSEMIRVCKLHGKVMVVDVVMPVRNVDYYNAIEILRDPSHTKALSIVEMENLFNQSGLKNIKKANYSVEFELEKQLAASFPNKGDDIKMRKMVKDDIGTDNIGIKAYYKNDIICYSVPISIYVGEKE